MNVANVAVAIFALCAVLGTMLDLAINNKRPDLELVHTVARASPEWAKKKAVAWSLLFAQAYLDFIFGSRSFSPRAFVVCIAISIITTLLVLGAMLQQLMGVGMSQKFIGWAVLFGIVDTLALFVTRRVIRMAASERFRAPQIVKLASALFAIAVIAYFASGLTWCVYVVVVALYEKHSVTVSLLFVTFAAWLPSLVITHNTELIPATIPAVFNTLVLLMITTLPALFLSTIWISYPLFLNALSVLLALPRWSGRAIAIACALLAALCKIVLKQ